MSLLTAFVTELTKARVNSFMLELSPPDYKSRKLLPSSSTSPTEDSKKLASSVESRLQCLLKKTSRHSVAISGYSLLQGTFSPLVSDQDIRGEHFVFECSISLDQKKICTQILIDTGASGYAFISDSFAQTHNLSLTPLSAPIVLETFDGRPVVSGNLTHKTTLDISMGTHSERMPLLVTGIDVGTGQRSH